MGYKTIEIREFKPLRTDESSICDEHPACLKWWNEWWMYKSSVGTYTSYTIDLRQFPGSTFTVSAKTIYPIAGNYKIRIESGVYE